MSDEQTETTDKDDKTDIKKSVDQKPSDHLENYVPSKGFATFGNQYFINLENELTEYSTDVIKAYATGTSKAKTEGCFAVICRPGCTPRTNITKYYKDFANSSLPKLLVSGRAIMPDKTSRYVYIYKDTLGKRVYSEDNGIAKGWKTDRVIETILIPIAMALNELQKRDIIHGNIRATNIYNGGKDKPEKFMLGECLSAPASFHQPVVFEPIERAMAAPIGRGEGTIKDDLYALGVLMAMHVRHFDPLKGKTDEEIMTAKVVTGSYSALIGSSDRVASGIADLLRGLLVDSEKARWSLEDVMDWLDGRRQNTKQPPKQKKADRAIEFDGTKFFYARTFAHRLFKNPQDAVQLIEGNGLNHWVERSIGDTDMIARLDMAFRAADSGGKGVGYWDRLLPLISIALDPDAPIRYRSLSLNIDALGNSLADAFIAKRGLANYVDLLSNGILSFWLTIGAEMNKDVSEYSKLFDRIKSFLRGSDIVSGIERCLYFLNPSIHCLSPLIENYYATDTAEYVVSLERVAETMDGNYPDEIIDKHAACFLISRDQKLIESHTFDLSSKEKFRYVMANLNILASIQRFNKFKPTPHLSKWIASLLDSSIERYHDAEQQKKIKSDIAKKVETGVLDDLLKTIDSPDKIKKDQVLYRRSINKYKMLENEKIAILKKLERPKYFSERTGQEWAATISGVISALIILGFLIVHYSGGVG